MVEEHLFFIDYIATEKDDTITDDTIISAANKADAIRKLEKSLYPERVIEIEWIYLLEEDDINIPF